MDRRGIRAAVERIARQFLGPKLDVLAAYPCRVVNQNSDGTLDLQPDSKNVPPPTGVPIKYGVPGISAKVANGARVMLEFAGGDPRFPMATLWDGAGLTELVVTASTKITVSAPLVRLADGDRPVARLGDPVVVLITPAIASSIVPGPPPTGGVPVAGYILQGSPTVKSA